MANDKRDDPTKSRYKVPNLERALAIMEHLLAFPQGRTLTELTDDLGQPKNSVFRITSTLLEHGYLLRDEAKRFTLSKKLLLMGSRSMGEQGFLENSFDVMRLCRDDIKESVFIGTIIENEGVVLEQVLGTHPFKFSIDSGHRLPLHCAAPCKAMLAYLPENEVDLRLRGYRFKRFNENTITSPAAFREELKATRAVGYALDREEEVHGAHCIAAPIFNQYAYPVAAIWTTGPSDRLTVNRFAAVGKCMRKYADMISGRLGHKAL